MPDTDYNHFFHSLKQITSNCKKVVFFNTFLTQIIKKKDFMKLF